MATKKKTKTTKINQDDEPLAIPNDTTVTGPSAPSSFVPQARRPVVFDLSRATIILYGPPKIGKSTLASQWPGAWFWATEPGQAWLDVYEPTVISDWDELLDLIQKVETAHPTKFGDGKLIRTIVIDTVDLLWKMCCDAICQRLGISSLADLDYGKGWSTASDEFQRALSQITRWPYGLVLISHSKEVEIKSKARKIDRTQPDMGTGGYRIVHALADIILYCYMNEQVTYAEDGTTITGVEEERRIRCQPLSNVVAGDRTGKLPEELPMSFKAIAKCFPATAKE